MKKAFDLSSYDDVRSNADAILGKVSGGSMPCDARGHRTRWTSSAAGSRRD
jgi:hypothetical protein